MTKRVNWLRLTVGYETVGLQPGEPIPNHHEETIKTFRGRIDAWRSAGFTEVPDDLDVDLAHGEWVATVLQLELDRAIATNSTPELRPNLRVGSWLRMDPYQLFDTLITGHNGVRCEISDAGWRNSVTHLIEQEDGSHWPASQRVVGYATLTWECPEGDEPA